MPAERFRHVREQEPIPPGATRVYRSLGSGVYHLDPDCHYLHPSMSVEVHSLVTAVNWPWWHRHGCTHCSLPLEALRAVIREHDQYGSRFDYQEALDNVV